MDTSRTRIPAHSQAPSLRMADGGLPPPGPGLDLERLERLRRLTRLMDTRWRIPGTRIGFGLDPIASLVPVLGDTLTAAVSVAVIVEAMRFGIPRSVVLRMGANVFVDWLIGNIPVAGTVFDVFFKANRRNLDLLHEHLERRLGGGPA